MKFLHRLEENFLIGLFMLAFVALTAQMASRYLLEYQFPFTEEIARFAFTWVVFFGAAYAMRQGGLMALSLLVDRFPDRPRAVVAVIMHLIGAVFFGLLVWHGTDVAWKVRNLPTIAMGISSSVEYAAIPAASLLMCIRSLTIAWHVVRHGRKRDGAGTLI